MVKLFKRIGLSTALLLGVVVACDEPEQEIFSDLTEDVIQGAGPEALEILKRGTYNSIVGTWGGHNSLWSLHEVSSDEMAITQKGADWEDGGQWIRTHRHMYQPTEEAINNGWQYCFGAVGEINTLINQNRQLTSLVSEMEVFRALVYLWLIDSYGNVPIITENSDDETPPTRTRQEVYSFIESSILDNLDSLTTEDTYGSINRNVANAMLSRLYLNSAVYTGNEEYQKAIDAADEVINSGLYSLSSGYFAPFSANNRNNMENIFVIPYDANLAGGFNLAQMTLHYSSQATFDLQEQPWNGYSSLEEFYNSFEDDDVRKQSFLEGPQFSLGGDRLVDNSAEPSDPDGPELTFTPFITELTPNALRQEGVRVGKFEFQAGAASSLSNDFPIFRYAEVLMNKAEALYRLGNTAEALEIVNEIRTRAEVSELTSLDDDTFLAERGREFFAEGLRRTDLIRFGRFNDAWWEKEPSDESKNIYPIPQIQRDTNPDLLQNPGY